MVKVKQLQLEILYTIFYLVQHLFPSAISLFSNPNHWQNLKLFEKKIVS